MQSEQLLLAGDNGKKETCSINSKNEVFTAVLLDVQPLCLYQQNISKL